MITAFSKDVPPRNTSVLVTLVVDELPGAVAFLEDEQASKASTENMNIKDEMLRSHVINRAKIVPFPISASIASCSWKH